VNYSKELKDPIFSLVQSAADESNLSTFVVGGWVRDLLLNKKQTKTDIDFVCVGSGIALAKKVCKKLGKGAILYRFKNFGTAMIDFNGENYEFVGARTESYSTDSRKPIIEEGSLQDDLNRRDFTINAMAIELNQENFGTLIDPFNGQTDLNNKIIRTPLNPTETYSDDPLRMMRAVRFANQLNFKIEVKSSQAIKDNSERLQIVSKERITEELNKILLCKKPSVGLNLLFESNLLKHFFHALENLHGVEIQDGRAHKDNFYHTLQVVDNIAKKTDNLWLVWAALLHDIAKPRTKKYYEKQGWTFHGHEFFGAQMVPKIFKYLKLPLNEKMRYVQKLVLLHLRPIVLAQEIVTNSAIRRLLFDAGDDIDDLMLLCDADITSKDPKKVARYLKNFQLVRQKLKEVEEKDHIRNFQPPINGEEIMNFFDIKAGKDIGIIKNAIKDAILDGEIKNNKKEAWDFMREKGKEINLTPKTRKK
jgi:putative nucleotidyltransferase with HDIG domain